MRDTQKPSCCSEKTCNSKKTCNSEKSQCADSCPCYSDGPASSSISSSPSCSKRTGVPGDGSAAEDGSEDSEDEPPDEDEDDAMMSSGNSNVSSSSSCSSQGGDNCCPPKKEAPEAAGSSKTSQGSDDCCSSKKESAPKPPCSSKSSQGSDDCCSSKKKESPPKASCSSKTSQGSDDCCSSKKESPSKPPCSSKSSQGGDDCCSSKKKESPPKASCSSKSSQGGDDCCSSKKGSAPKPPCSSKSSQGGDDCCSSKKKESPPKPSCSSKSSQGGDGCCSKKESAPKPPCSSKSSQGGDGCCSSKKESAPKPPCSSKSSQGGGGCCSSKKESAPKPSCSSKSSQGGGGCCSSKKGDPSKSSCSAPKVPPPPCSSSRAAPSGGCSSKKGLSYGSAPSSRGSINSSPAEKRSSWWPSWFPFGDDEESSGEKQPLLKGSKSADYGGDEGEEPVRLALDIEGMTCDGCGAQIQNFLGSQPGVVDVSVSVLTKRGTFDYFPSRISEEEISAFLHQLGFTASVVPNSTEGSFYMRVSSVGPGSSGYQPRVYVNEESVRNHLGEIPGVHRAILEQMESNGDFILFVVYDFHLTSTRALLKSAEGMGDINATLVPSRSMDNRGSAQEDQVAMWKNSLFITIALGLPVVVLSITESVLGHPLWSAVVPGTSCLRILDLIQFLLATIVQFWIGQSIYERAWSSVYYGGRADMDVLIACSTTVAWGYSTVGLVLNCFLDGYEADLFFDTCVILMALIILGRYLEIMAKGEASKKLNSILSLQAPTAILVDEHDQSEHELDIELICQQDLVKILPGMAVPLDGFVFQGESTVDESMVTGESLPIQKAVGDPVLGGTINQDGLLLVRITKIHSEGTLAQMHTLMEEAQHQKPKAQRVADRVASYFVPIIIGLSVVMFVMWFLLCSYGVIEPQEGLGCATFSLKFMITMLIISCPCAIALAAPTPLVVAAGMAAKLGAVLKSSITFETLQKVDTLVVDKTGTLTYGQLVVSGVGVAPGISMEDFLWLCGSAESGSEHPIGKALASYAREHVSKDLSLPGEFEAKRGAGLVCDINGRQVRIGASVWLDGESPGHTWRRLGAVVTSEGKNCKAFEESGLSLIFVEIDKEPVGFFALRDNPKPHVSCMIQACQERGVEVFMLSGDSEAAVRSLGAVIGMDPRHCLARHTPEMKSEVIDRFQKEGKVVAFVGDGVNDSIGLAQADVGIAVNEGTSIAIEAADVVLMRDDLWILVQLIDLARATYRLIKFNFLWAFIYNLIALPLSGGLLYPFTGFQLPPFYAGFAEMISSLPVICFSLLLKYYSPDDHSDCRRYPQLGFDILSLL